MTKTTPDIAKLAADPGAFRDALLIETDSGIKPLGAVCDPWQVADFTALDPGWLRVCGRKVPGRLRAWLERPRGHSKTSDLAAQVLWCLFASKRSLRGVIAAADRDQARLLSDAITRLVGLNHWLRSVIDCAKNTISNTRTGSRVEVLSSDAASSYGLTPDFIVCDEITHWGSRELWDSLLSSAAKKANCLLLVITNAGWSSSWQFTTREAIRTDPAWHFNSLPDSCASWIGKQTLAEQERLLPPAAFNRLWRNRWSSGAGDAIPEHDLAAAVEHDLGGWNARRDGWVIAVGLDLAVSRDDAASVMVALHIGSRTVKTVRRRKRRDRLHPHFEMAKRLGMMDERDEFDFDDDGDDGYERKLIVSGDAASHRLMVCGLQVWSPGFDVRINLQRIEDWIIAQHERFQFKAIAVDPFQAEHLCQRLQRLGLPVVLIPPTMSNLQLQATALMEAMADKRLTIPNDKRLIGDLQNLRLVERSSGFRLISPRQSRRDRTDGASTTHGDLASALCLALQSLRDAKSPESAYIDADFIV